MHYLLSWPLGSTAPYPGDPGGHPACLCANFDKEGYVVHVIENITDHSGTHMDTPGHMFPGKPCAPAYWQPRNLEGMVIDIPDTVTQITEAHVAPYADKIKPGDALFFKTKSSSFDPAVYRSDFTTISPSLATWLIAQGIEWVGIDSLSVDPADDPHFSTHRALLSKDVLIIELLKLRDLPADMRNTRIRIHVTPVPIQSAPKHGEVTGAPVVVWANPM